MRNARFYRTTLTKQAFVFTSLFAASGLTLSEEPETPPWDVSAPSYSAQVQEIELSVTEGTWMNLDVSPDGQHIAFDLLGDIYQIPITGGEATPLLSGHAWEIQPQYSPDGRFLAFTSDRNGADNIWVVDIDNPDNKHQITHESFRLLNNPSWHPSGEYLVAKKHFTTSRSLGTGEVWLYDANVDQALERGNLEGSVLVKRPSPAFQKELGEPTFSADGESVFYIQNTTPGNTFIYHQDSNGEVMAIKRYDLETGEIEKVVGGAGGAVRPTPSPDGKTLAFVKRVRAASRLFVMDLASGEQTMLVDDLDPDMQETWAVQGAYPTMAWTPDGDLIFRESIFHHTQVETPYGPVRQQNSGWFAWEPKLHRLTAFGTHASTNPWGVTFDDWGQHVASYPIFASAHHALDPPYPEQHPRPSGMQAYSGVCGQEFIDFPNWPKDLQGSMVKVRYKSTNRVEILKWNEYDYGYEEQYVSDIIFSTNLSFIPVDLRYGPQGGMYVCDWYNPVKGHAQYSLRDERRDRKSGRIWRIFPKGAKPVQAPKISGAGLSELLEILKRREYRYRYWAKRELREMEPAQVKKALDQWVENLDPKDPRFRHHQVEAMWAYRNVEEANLSLLRELLACENHNARAAAARQLRHWHGLAKDGDRLLASAANDENGLVRLEAAIACSYVGSKQAFETLAGLTTKPNEKHLSYAINTSLGSAPMRKFWNADTVEKTHPEVHAFLFRKKIEKEKAEKSKRDSKFDRQKNLLKVKVSCVKERMIFATEYMDKPNLGEYKFAPAGDIPAKPNQPVRIEFSNPDATPHNLVLVQPGSLEEVGLAANEMAKDPEAAKSGQFIPKSKKIILHTKMLKQGETEVLRFKAPGKPGVYPYLCSFPGHWTIMKGNLIVK